MGCRYHAAIDGNGDLIEWEEPNWKVNSKVFETEIEARNYSRDLMAHGGLGGWMETDEPVTHIYLGDGMTEEIEDYFIGYEEASKNMACDTYGLCEGADCPIYYECQR